VTEGTRLWSGNQSFTPHRFLGCLHCWSGAWIGCPSSVRSAASLSIASSAKYLVVDFAGNPARREFWRIPLPNQTVLFRSVLNAGWGHTTRLSERPMFVANSERLSDGHGSVSLNFVADVSDYLLVAFFENNCRNTSCAMPTPYTAIAVQLDFRTNRASPQFGR